MKNDLLPRIGAGLIFLLVMIAGILWHPLALGLLFSLIVFLASHEYSRLIGMKSSLLYALLASGAFALSYFFRLELLYFLLFIPLASGLVLFVDGGSWEKKVAWYPLGFILIPLSFLLLTSPLIAGPSRHGLLFFFILLWTNDTMAYVTGRLLGKNKLWERISPKKTWEGFIGGLLFALAVAYFTHPYFGLNREIALITAFIVSCFGTLGDLFESSLKRKAKVKDSGSIMPGHGGLLDRFDGVLFSSPLLFSLLYVWQLLS